MLVDGKKESAELFKTTLNDRLENYGINIEKTSDRLASFNSVTNTYLSVFAVFGALGMLIGVIGLGFVLLKNYNQRKQEFALMMAVGFPIKNIRKMIFSEQLLILITGISIGIISAIVATLPSLKNNYNIPWLLMGLMIVVIIATGLAALLISLKSVTKDSLITSLKKE
jgi:ABC-type antimicrobial peptide transport system permease subunit